MERLIKFIKIINKEEGLEVSSIINIDVNKNYLNDTLNKLKKYVDIKEPFYMTIENERFIVIPDWLPIKISIKAIKMNWMSKWDLNGFDDHIQILNDNTPYPFAINFSKFFKDIHTLYSI